MADVSDPNIASTYAEVRKKDASTDWLLCGYESNKKIVLVSSGSGGVKELASHLSNEGCFYGYLRVTLTVEQTTRTKFVFITFKGDNAPVMRKGNMSVHVSQVKSVIKDFNIEVSAATVDEVDEEAIIKKLSAANY